VPALIRSHPGVTGATPQCVAMRTGELNRELLDASKAVGSRLAASTQRGDSMSSASAG
jgi:hypothetical protein